MIKQAGTLEAKDLERMNASEEAPSTSCLNSIVTSEELTLRNCSGENFNVISNLSGTDKLQTAESRWHDLSPGRLGYRGSPSRVNVLEDVGFSSNSELDRKTLNNQGSVDTASHGEAAGRFNSGEMSNLCKDLVCVTKPELLDRNSPENNCCEVKETGSQIASSNASLSLSNTRTKILSNSGITQYFVKDKLRDKGILCRGPAPRGEFRDQSYPEASSSNKLDISAPLNSNGEVVLQVDESRHKNVTRDMVRPPPPVIPNSGTLLNSNRETGVAPIHAIPNQVRNLNTVTPRPPPPVIPRQFFRPVFTEVPPSQLYQTVLNPVQHIVTPLHPAIPTPGTLCSSSSEMGMPSAIPSLFPNLNSESVMLHHDGVSLREWVKFGENKRNKLKNLHIFKQIVDAVGDFHSKGIILLDLRPSYFKLMQSNKVTYIGSIVQIENYGDQDDQYRPNYQNEKRPMDYSNIPDAKRKKLEESPKLVISEPQFPNESGLQAANENNVKCGGQQFTGNVFCDKSNPEAVHVTGSDSKGDHMSDSSKLLLGSAKYTSEEAKWYASPEELNERQCVMSSNIYSLGILLVELLCSFDSDSDRDIAMLSIRNNKLPLHFLEGNSREAELCLWLLDPEPSVRPSIREILETDAIKEIEDLINPSSSSNLDDTESELLLHFLESLQQQKHNRASKLMEEIKLLEADIEEVEKRQGKMSLLPEESVHARAEVPGQSSSGVDYDKSAPFCNKEGLIKNIDQLEKLYFSVRSTLDSSNSGPVRCDVKDLFECQKTSYHTKKDGESKKLTDGLGVFYNGLCKYARYTKFKVCGTLRNENILNSNMVCSLSFDRNEEFFAAAGVSKKIKIYDFQAVLNNTVDIHYPVTEMSNNSKFSCTNWNNYIRNCLASTDYDGVVKLWDAGTGKAVNQYTEHSRRAWSLDFSHTRPTTLASAGDDCCVKIWDITQKSSVMTVRGASKVCSVQFSMKSSHLIAHGDVDFKTYCFDLRNATKPWCVLLGHTDAVSYVRFLDSKTLVTASTDSTLKIWDLSKTSCISTLRGHTNDKGFVGLSVTDDGYIMCGSETNEVFAYHRNFPMPITSYKFRSVDPITGKETGDDDSHFVTSVCSRKKSELMVAGNSAGCIKVLQMV
ncbi:Ubiquitin ligase protein cop1 [Heracleum sosnowskyi]|uniref:Ubiquitin ligase protein cop1 n=1 Tax=Heracleum sosnowskyi TaxID=360622 RepID=A0AAD8MLC8_9APIA|nr:Ubiquitin ligase protein cop1 [Heracleum sosnowskyi]